MSDGPLYDDKVADVVNLGEQQVDEQDDHEVFHERSHYHAHNATFRNNDARFPSLTSSLNFDTDNQKLAPINRASSIKYKTMTFNVSKTNSAAAMMDLDDGVRETGISVNSFMSGSLGIGGNHNDFGIKPVSSLGLLSVSSMPSVINDSKRPEDNEPDLEPLFKNILPAGFEEQLEIHEKQPDAAIDSKNTINIQKMDQVAESRIKSTILTEIPVVDDKPRTKIGKSKSKRASNGGVPPIPPPKSRKPNAAGTGNSNPVTTSVVGPTVSETRQSGSIVALAIGNNKSVSKSRKEKNAIEATPIQTQVSIAPRPISSKFTLKKSNTAVTNLNLSKKHASVQFPGLVLPLAHGQVQQQPSPGQNTLSITTFNILAPIYFKGTGKYKGGFESAHEDQYIARHRHLVEVIRRIDSDVVCLQEVWLPSESNKINKNGVLWIFDQGLGDIYAWETHQRTGNKEDGLLILFKKNKFIKHNTRAVSYKTFLKRHRVGLVVHLEANDVHYIIANTHLFFPASPIDRAGTNAHVQNLREEIADFTENEGVADNNITFICGDFNASYEKKKSDLGMRPKGSIMNPLKKMLGKNFLAQLEDDGYEVCIDPKAKANDAWCSHMPHTNKAIDCDLIFFKANFKDADDGTLPLKHMHSANVTRSPQRIQSNRSQAGLSIGGRSRMDSMKSLFSFGNKPSHKKRTQRPRMSTSDSLKMKLEEDFEDGITKLNMETTPPPLPKRRVRNSALEKYNVEGNCFEEAPFLDRFDSEDKIEFELDEQEADQSQDETEAIVHDIIPKSNGNSSGGFRMSTAFQGSATPQQQNHKSTTRNYGKVKRIDTLSSHAHASLANGGPMTNLPSRENMNTMTTLNRRISESPFVRLKNPNSVFKLQSCYLEPRQFISSLKMLRPKTDDLINEFFKEKILTLPEEDAELGVLGQREHIRKSSPQLELAFARENNEMFVNEWSKLSDHRPKTANFLVQL